MKAVFADAFYFVALWNRSDQHHATLTDCTSFVVMRDGNITDALTGDHHFEQAGFKALPV